MVVSKHGFVAGPDLEPAADFCPEAKLLPAKSPQFVQSIQSEESANSFRLKIRIGRLEFRIADWTTTFVEVCVMGNRDKRWVIAWSAAFVWFGGVAASNAQVRRYEPSRPTVSPYLSLFREQTGILPNYQALVRPQQLQYEANRTQQRFNQQNAEEVESLRAEVYDLQQRQATELTMSPTGKGGWFARPSQRQQFMNTSRYYSQSGTAAARRPGR
jgi:hypothetical protein